MLALTYQSCWCASQGRKGSRGGVLFLWDAVTITKSLAMGEHPMGRDRRLRHARSQRLHYLGRRLTFLKVPSFRLLKNRSASRVMEDGTRDLRLLVKSHNHVLESLEQRGELTKARLHVSVV